MARFKIKRSYIRGQYLDMPYYMTNWFDEYVAKCTSYGLMGGYSNGTFQPGGSITVGECLVIASNMRDIYNGGDGTCPAGGTPWYSMYVSYATKQGIIEDDDFEDYSAPATRAQVAHIFANALPSGVLKEVYGRARFSDVNSRTPFRSDINELYKAGVIGGYEDGTFRPENTITRAEVCVMISNILGQ